MDCVGLDFGWGSAYFINTVISVDACQDDNIENIKKQRHAFSIKAKWQNFLQRRRPFGIRLLFRYFFLPFDLSLLTPPRLIVLPPPMILEMLFPPFLFSHTPHYPSDLSSLLQSPHCFITLDSLKSAFLLAVCRGHRRHTCLEQHAYLSENLPLHSVPWLTTFFPWAN